MGFTKESNAKIKPEGRVKDCEEGKKRSEALVDHNIMVVRGSSWQFVGI